MKISVIIHEAEEGGYWAEVPALKGCVSQAESYDEMLLNIKEAIELYLDAEIDQNQLELNDKLIELSN